MASTPQDQQADPPQGGEAAPAKLPSKLPVKRGFAAMDPARQREIASQGGRAAHVKGTAHQFTPEEARQAGSKGGRVAHQRGTAHQFDSDEAREAGRKGGQASSNGGEGTPADAPQPTAGQDADS